MKLTRLAWRKDSVLICPGSEDGTGLRIEEACVQEVLGPSRYLAGKVPVRLTGGSQDHNEFDKCVIGSYLSRKHEWFCCQGHR